MNKSLVDLAYEFLIKRKHAGFKEIYDYVKIAKETPIEAEAKEMVNLYTDMVLDNRFLLIQDNEWGGVRQDYKFDEIKKQLEFLFAINDNIDPKKLEVTEIIDEVDNTFEESIDDEEDELEIDSDDEEDEVDWDEIEKEMEENN